MRRLTLLISLVAVLFEMNDLVKSCNGAYKEIDGMVSEMTYSDEQRRQDSIQSADSAFYADSIALAKAEWRQARANRDSLRDAAFVNVASWSGKYHIESWVASTQVRTDFTLIPTKGEAYKGQFRIIVDDCAALRGTISGVLDGNRLHINMIRYDYTPDGEGSDPTDIAAMVSGRIFTMKRSGEDEYSIIESTVSPLLEGNITEVTKVQ